MEIVIKNIYCFLELWMMQTYAGLVWRQKVCFRGFSWLLFLMNGVVFTCIELGILPGFCSVFIHVILFLYLWLHFKISLKENIARYCIMFIIVWITEVVSAFILHFFLSYLPNKNWGFVLVNAISLIIAFLVVYIVRKKKLGSIEPDSRQFLKTVLICIVPIIILLAAYQVSHRFKVWYNIFIAVYCAILLLYFLKLQKAQTEVEQKKLELHINKIYGDVYKNDINDLRKKQHEFKNQLAAVYSSHKTAKSLDELIEIQQKYCDMLQEESAYEYILTACEESILAGFLHYKCVYCRNKGVKVDADIHAGKWTGCIMLHELIELLGILMDNALEQELENDFSGKKIYLTFVELEDKFYISVENRLKEGLKAELAKMFEAGYSTKGEQRGLGLSRAKQICDRYGQEIQVMLDGKTGIKFELEVLKQDKCMS